MSTTRRTMTVGAIVAATALAGVVTAGTASASSNRTICAESVTIRTGDNQPIGYTYHGDTFVLDHYSPSGAYAVGTAIKSNNEHIDGYIIANTITDASGHCQSPYN